MYRKCLRDGIVDKKIGKKGVLLARRDNSKFVRDIYETVISKIADDESRDDIIYYIIQEINALCSGSKPYTDFVITKAVGNCGELQPEAFVNEKESKRLNLVIIQFQFYLQIRKSVMIKYLKKVLKMAKNII